ncbi:MAG: SDR family oxidoreductase [Anaerolineales bacterium]|nr:SDR family oxidoreductase [Anaerolineales bacterium]
MSLKDKVVVITGATGVLGSLTAKTFAAQGALLVLVGTDQAGLAVLEKQLELPVDRSLTITADLRDARAVQAAANEVQERFKHVDVLLHLVGGWTGGKSLVDSEAEDLEFMLNQHAWTTFHLARAFTSLLVSNNWGRVIVVSSPLANQPSANMGPYSAGKAAQEALLQTLAAETRDSGVTANIIQVRMIAAEGKGKGSSPQQIVAAMMYLCSEEASQVTGARIPLYG